MITFLDQAYGSPLIWLLGQLVIVAYWADVLDLY